MKMDVYCMFPHLMYQSSLISWISLLIAIALNGTVHAYYEHKCTDSTDCQYPECSSGYPVGCENGRKICYRKSDGNICKPGPCVPGKMRIWSNQKDGVCAFCQAGKYSAVWTWNYDCDFCPAGKYSSVIGATTGDTCIACPSATLYSIIASSACTELCPTGTYASINSQCLPCPPGRFSGITGMTVCSLCPAGTYSDGNGFTACIMCQAGKYSNALATGTYASINSQCLPCPPGRFSGITGMTVCSSCPAGTYSDGNGFTACIMCQAGKYSAALAGDPISICSLCIEGKYSSASGASSEAICTMCSAGKYSYALGLIQESSCTMCAAGTYSTTTGSTMSQLCLMCLGGTYSSTLGASSDLKCIPCPAGTYSFNAGANSLSMCSPCTKGKYSSASGLKDEFTCSLCIPGTYSDITGASICTLCSMGTYSAIYGASSNLNCQPCQPGQYSMIYGSTVCQACPINQCSLPGQYSTCGNSTLGDCSICQNALPVGTAYYYITTGKTEYSSVCPVKIASQGRYRNCTNPRAPMAIIMTFQSLALDFGFCDFQNTNNGQPFYFCTAPDPADSKYVWWQGTQWVAAKVFGGSPITAGPSADEKSYLQGEYQPITALYSQLQDPANSVIWELPCPSGTYAPTAGSTACTQADAGYYVASNGQSAQTRCIAGTFSYTGASICTDKCPDGTTKAAGGAQCILTSPGSYSSAGVATPCPKGTFTSMTGATVCTNCIAGSYNSITGVSSSADCTLCGAGSYTSASGSPDCTACNPGKYNMASGVTVCALCPVGKYSSVAGFTTDCAWCTNGINYTYSTGSSACTACTAACPVGKKIQNLCIPTSDIYCGPCTPIANCFYIPGTPCGNATNPNCLCLPGFELIGNQCQQCRQGTFKSTSSSLPCAAWNTRLTCSPGYFLTNGTRFTDTSCLQCPGSPGNGTMKGSGCQWGCKAGYNNTVFE